MANSTHTNTISFRNITVGTLLVFSVAFSSISFAWNTPAKYIVALSILKNGEIHFTLSDQPDGASASEFHCKETGRDRQWLKISSCVSGDLQCLAAVNRMTSTLISAKLNVHKVHVYNENCLVTAVALRQN